MENAQRIALLEELLKQKQAELTALREISRAISSAWGLNQTLSLITHKTAEVMHMDSCSIYLREQPDSDVLVLKASTGLAAEAIGRARLKMGEGLPVGPPNIVSPWP